MIYYALITISHLPRKHIGKEGNEREQGDNGHADNEGDTLNSIVGALVTSESEACRVIFSADGTICAKQIAQIIVKDIREKKIEQSDQI